MALDFDNNRDGTVTVYPPIASEPGINRPTFGVRLDESDLAELTRAVQE